MLMLQLSIPQKRKEYKRKALRSSWLCCFKEPTF